MKKFLNYEINIPIGKIVLLILSILLVSSLFGCDLSEYVTYDEAYNLHGRENAITHVEYYDENDEFVEYGPMMYYHDIDSVDNIYCIDDSLSESYILEFEEAVKVYDDYDFIFLDTIVSDDCSSYDLRLSGYYVNDEYVICDDSDLPDDCHDEDAMAYNRYWFDTETGEIFESEIWINFTEMDAIDSSGRIQVLVHEIGHTYGLLDLQEDIEGLYYLEEYTIMYWMYSDQDFEGLPQFDEENLEWLYIEEGMCYCGK